MCQGGIPPHPLSIAIFRLTPYIIDCYKDTPNTFTMASASKQCCPLLASKFPFNLTKEYIAYRVKPSPVVNEGWTEEQWRALAQDHDGYEIALQSVKVNEGLNVKSLPPELCHNIINMAAMSFANDRKEAWEAIHHTLQPCSVCAKLVAVDVDDDGNILSTGKITTLVF